MADNIVNARIQLKNDTEANWQSAINFKPRKGELIISTTDSTHPFPMLRVGDGVTAVKDLPILNLQTDWNAADSSSGYIKNKPIIVKNTSAWNSDNTIYSAGTILIYSDYKIVSIGSQAYNVAGIKIADGSHTSSVQPFIDTDTVELLAAHINNTTIHITQAERELWNNKLNYENEINNETLIFNRL